MAYKSDRFSFSNLPMSDEMQGERRAYEKQTMTVYVSIITMSIWCIQMKQLCNTFLLILWSFADYLNTLKLRLLSKDACPL